jgi:hypothetical protein
LHDVRVHGVPAIVEALGFVERGVGRGAVAAPAAPSPGT